MNNMTNQQLAGKITFHRRAERIFRSVGLIAYADIANARRKAFEQEQVKCSNQLCICLQYIGDNGPCPVHGKGSESR